MIRAGSELELRVSGKRAYARDAQRLRILPADLKRELNLVTSRYAVGMRNTHSESSVNAIDTSVLPLPRNALLMTRNAPRKTYVGAMMWRYSVPTVTTAAAPSPVMNTETMGAAKR